MKARIFPLLLFSIFINRIKCEENIYIVNTKRPLHVVNDKFLSISIDPAILLTRINLSDISLKMARHLSPAYVRIAGPSTEFVKYIDTGDKSSEIASDDLDSVIVTPSVWFAINEWFNMANLTPVFGINDAETAMGVWNPKSILPLFEISDKFNLTCLWQLGYDCSNKSDIQYVEDLKILRHILDAFPDRKKSWEIVGSNVRECSTNHGSRRIIEELKGITDYVMWEHLDNEIGKSGNLETLMLSGRNHPKIWTVGSKSKRSVTFETALEWAKEVGDAAKSGFDVIMRQPRLHEFFVDTPVFWFSLLYKTLVGNMILDIKSTGPQTKSEAYAYCAKNQNNFIHRGAMVVMIVNPEEIEHISQVRIGTLAKTMEVQSYILTTKSDMRTVYLNGERLDSSLFKQDKINFVPKLRRAKPMNGITFTVPPKSIGFFVLPGAKISTCINEDDEMPLLMEEIQEDQQSSFSEEVAVDLNSRFSQGNSKSLKEMQRNLEEELKADEKFYHVDKKGKISGKLEDMLENMREFDTKSNERKEQFKIDDDTRKKILERAKLTEAQKKLTESEQRLINLGKLFLTKSDHSDKIKRDSMEKSKIKPWTFPKSNTLQQILANNLNHHHQLHKHNLALHNLNVLNNDLLHLKPKNLHEQLRRISEKNKHNFLRKQNSDIELELSSSEIEKILADRVKLRAAKTNIRFTNDELAALMKKATDRLKFNHILTQRDKRQTRSQRDINMKLVNEISKQESKKSRKPLNLYEESEELPIKKTSKRKPHVIVNPFTKKSIKEQNKDLSADWSDYDSDFYFDENSSSKKIKNYGGKNSRKSKNLHEMEEKKFSFGIPQMKTRRKDDDDENDFERKYMRLEEYFKNAKKIQEKYDDIDFSDSDYSDMESDEKPTRYKRDNSKICSCKHSKGTESKCQCNMHKKEEVMKMIHDLLREAKKDENKNEYKKLADSVNEKIGKKTKRSINGTVIHNYQSVFDHPHKRKPEDILLLGRTLPRSSRYHGARKINDYHLYRHLLRNDIVKRSVDDNEIEKNSGENEIKKEKSEDLVKNSQLNGTVVLGGIKNRSNFDSFLKNVQEKVSNIQKVPKEKAESIFHDMVKGFTSFVYKVGDKIKNYFEGLIK